MPQNLEIVDPRARAFPPSWRDAAIRELYDQSVGGIICPYCGCSFSGLKQLKMLHADHIIAYTREGLTTWENLQLLCQSCNLKKYNNTIVVK